MAYSRWGDGIGCFWYTSPETGGAENVKDSKLIVNPKVGERVAFTYAQLKALSPDLNWVALTFPDAPMKAHAELLFFVDAFFEDMEHNVYRYSGFKTPTAGVVYDEQRTYSNIQHIPSRRL